MDKTAASQAEPPSVDTTFAQALEVMQGAQCLYSEAEVQQAVEVLSQDITHELATLNPVILVVMTGGLVFAGQLLLRLNFPLQVDYVHVTRYQGGTVGYEVSWLARSHLSLRHRHLLVVDDILDEGHTLAAILKDCQKTGAASVRSAVLVEKDHDRKFEGVRADFIGLHVEDHFVFGYGLDYREYWRNAQGIYAVNDPV